VTGEKSGNPQLLKKLSETEAGIGYADLGDVVTNAEVNKAGFFDAHIQNATGTEFVAPNAGKGANCDYRSLSLPALGTPEGAVGLNAEDNWATDNKEGNRGNAANLGSKYPICGLTFDFVYTGLDNGAVANANSRLTADQRRTMYSFFTFMYSSAAQENYNQFEYAALPPSWVGTIREGFQANF
jgi:ABC-type phosphate transport system substrate-binding protein